MAGRSVYHGEVEMYIMVRQLYGGIVRSLIHFMAGISDDVAPQQLRYHLHHSTPLLSTYRH